ncbi:DgyrCDS9630 [Dimorphilus gyrociliatus]|uniref:DgyrCDS9630 n=1 Tax=Dimorphilus gyrociliatus TaxID=2664684 RepID=A0A7I8VZQ9_9ANNE|nr:DgyrCDS9630 [Dimorphilus gyrociliatus]
MKCFDIGVYVVIAANFAFFFINTIRLSIRFQKSRNFEQEEKAIEHEAYTLIFVSIYVVEMSMKLLGLGPVEYFKSGWNRFDCVVTILGFIGGFIAYAKPTLTYIIILRPLRLLRLFKLKSRYREVLGTVSVLGDRMFNIAIVMILLFYSFAIVGMELFSKYEMKDCCRNTSVEIQYAYRYAENNNTGYYYLNNFENILASSVTLFELTVVNNWYIIMNGYAFVTSEWYRIYFMVFYIATMVVLTVIVAFILESFMFRIKYKKRMSEVEDEEDYHIEDHVRFQVVQTLTEKELQLCEDALLMLKPLYAEPNTDENSMSHKFVGEKVQSKDDFGLRMYSDEVVEWLEEERLKLENNSRPTQVLVDHLANGTDEGAHLA